MIDITLEEIKPVPPPVYKPRRLVITVKSPQDELFIRHLIQRIERFKNSLAAPLAVTRISDYALTDEEEEFLKEIEVKLISGVLQ